MAYRNGARILLMLMSERIIVLTISVARKISARMIDLLTSPWIESFDALVSSASSSLFIASPYITKAPCDRIVSAKANTSGRSQLNILLITDLSRDTLLSGATDVSAILAVANFFPSVDVRFLPSIHAKVYIADDQVAIVTSGNMTNNGLVNNFEYGVKIDDKNLILRIREDITRYSLLGTSIDKERLKYLADTSRELTNIRIEAEKSIKAQLRNEFKSRLRKFEDEIIRTRAAGRAPHTIFAETILYLLSRKPMSTVEMHRHIKSIHPDLCDDTVDRVIDGKHFGKKWKHAVRTAQQHLKREGMIELENGIWHPMTANPSFDTN